MKEDEEDEYSKEKKNEVEGAERGDRRRNGMIYFHRIWRARKYIISLGE